MVILLPLPFNDQEQGLEGGCPDPAFPLLFYENPASRHLYITFLNPPLFFSKTHYKCNGAEKQSRFAQILAFLSRFQTALNVD